MSPLATRKTLSAASEKAAGRVAAAVHVGRGVGVALGCSNTLLHVVSPSSLECNLSSDNVVGRNGLCGAVRRGLAV